MWRACCSANCRSCRSRRPGPTRTKRSCLTFACRAPLLILLAGAALSGSGAAYQGLFRNPLADPYIIGVASGAGLGAVIAMALHWPATILGALVIPIAAFVGALITVGVVYGLARVGRATPDCHVDSGRRGDRIIHHGDHDVPDVEFASRTAPRHFVDAGRLCVWRLAAGPRDPALHPRRADAAVADGARAQRAAIRRRSGAAAGPARRSRQADGGRWPRR